MTSQSSASIAPGHQLPASTSPPPRKRRHLWIWAVIIILFGLLFWWVISQHQKSQAAAMGGGGRRGMITGPIPVVPATAKTGNLGVYLDAIGTVTPVYTDQITAQVTGVITAVHYTEGQLVKKGDPLVDIDPRTYEAQVVEAQGALERDQNLLAEAQMDLKRYQDAWAKNAIPRQTLEDQEKLVLQDQGTVKNDQGTLQYDQVELAYCHITSPINGRVGLRLVDPGNLVTANSSTVLVTVAQLQPITVIFTIPETNVGQVVAQMRHTKGLPVQAWDAENTKQLGMGKLETMDNLIDTETGTVKMRAVFPNRDTALFPNQFVNTRLLVTTMQNQIIVPSSAIQHNGDQAFVYLIEPGPGNPVGESPQGSGTNEHGTTAPTGGSGPGGSPEHGSNANKPAGAPKVQYHVVQTSVTTGVTDNGMTAVQGIQAGDVVADSTFDKLINGAPVSLSKQGIQTTQTTISGESAAP